MTFLLLASLLWPAPCADAGTCWLAWGPPRVDRYEVWARGVKCATLAGHRKPNGGWVNPRQWYQPRPGDGCWRAGESAVYTVRACTDNVCGPFGAGVEFGPQEFMCFNSRGPIPCEE